MSKLTIEAAEMTRFRALFKQGGYAGNRFGQAFYNHFNLHKLTDQQYLNKLYNERSDEKAEAQIFELFSLS